METVNKKNEENKDTLRFKKGDHISRALVETKFSYTEGESPLFCLKFILAKSWAQLNSFISELTPCENMSFFKKHNKN